MFFDNIFSGARISSSGMSAERTRMEVIARNLANANATRGPDGEPFRRQEAVFATVLDQQRNRGALGLGGVEVAEIASDNTPFPELFMPGHPDANAEGFVRMPNVSIPVEMVNLLVATRSYEANVKAMQSYRQMLEQALFLLRT